MPIKSAFAPMVPKVDPRIATKQPAPPPAVKQPEAVQQPVKPTQEIQLPAPKPPEPIPDAAEIWLELADRPDRQVFGWHYVFKGENTAAVIVLNTNHWLSQTALVGAEPKLLPLLCAIQLSELLLVRGRQGGSWLRIMFRKLAKKVGPDNPAVGNLHYFAELLAASSQFVELGTRIAAEPEKRRFWIATDKLAQATPIPSTKQ